jgi:hypothetical protein
MVASHPTVEGIVNVLLKYIDKRTALRIARDLYKNVPGNKSVTDTFKRLTDTLAEMQDEG